MNQSYRLTPPIRRQQSALAPFRAALALLTAALLLGTTALAQEQPAAGPAGTWVGAIQIPGAPLGVQVTLSQEGDAWSGQIDIPAQGALGIPLEPVTVEGGTATFTIAGVPGDATFEGTVEGDTLSGSFTQAGQEFPFELERAEQAGAGAVPAEPGADPAGDAESPAASSVPAGPAEGEYVDPQGRFSLQVPTGWTATEHDGFVRVEGADGLIRMDVVVSPTADPAAAVDEAWALTAPDVELEETQSLEPPSDPGVDRTLVANYDAGDPTQIYQAVAQVVGDETYVLLVYGELGTLQRLNAQLQIVATSFTIDALEATDLTNAEAVDVREVIPELREFATRALQAYSIPGASLAIVQGGEIVHMEGFGVTEAGGGEPITPETRMMIGSIGKTMTSMLVANLVDDGLLAWDTPVVELLPRFALADDELTPTLTVRNLLCACIGVPRRDLELAFNYDELSAEGVIESLRAFEFFTGFGEVFQYSNQLVATAGYAAAAAAGATYGQLYEGYAAALHERVLEPIGMPATTVDFDAVLEAGDHAIPHQLDLNSGVYEPMDMEYERLLLPVAPAGTHWSTAADMARYLQTVLAVGAAPDGERVASEENMLVTWEPQVQISATDDYGLGWIVSDFHGLPMLSHGGNTLGFSSDMVFLPTADLGIIVLANAQGVNAFTGGVASRLLELVYDLPTDTEAFTAFQIEQIDQVLTEQRDQVVDRVPLADSLRYFGAYTNPALGEVSLRIEEGQLMLDAGEWSMQVRPLLDRQGEPDGYITYGAPLTGLPLRFEEGEDGDTVMVLGDGIVSYTFERVE